MCSGGVGGGSGGGGGGAGRCGGGGAIGGSCCCNCNYNCLISMQVFGLLYRSEYKAEYIGRKPYIEYSSTILQCTVIGNTIGWFPRAGRWRRVSSYRSISGGRFANTGGREGGVGTHSHHFMDR